MIQTRFHDRRFHIFGARNSVCLRTIKFEFYCAMISRKKRRNNIEMSFMFLEVHVDQIDHIIANIFIAFHGGKRHVKCVVTCS